MIRNVTFEETTYAEAPAKFEAGTPNIADAVGLGAALDYVERLGRPAIAKYEQGLLQYATEQLSRINGLRLIGTARERSGCSPSSSATAPPKRSAGFWTWKASRSAPAIIAPQPSLRRFGLEATVRPSLPCTTPG